MITELPSMRCAIWGMEGTWKSSKALSFPKPIVHFDIDVGGFNRATWANLPTPRVDLDGITSKSYVIPIGMERLVGTKSGPTVRFPKKVTGYRETWQEIIMDFVAACQDKAVKSIIMDSATGLWEICHKSLLQEKQEIQLGQNPRLADADLRERLQPVEFPNDRMSQLIYTAQSMDKNLIMIHYPKDEYAGDQKTGKQIIDGFKHTEKIVDVVFYTELKRVKINGTETWRAVSKVTTKCGYPGLGTDALGMELPSPDYQGIIDLYKLINGIEEE